jgi:hypothetical protein
MVAVYDHAQRIIIAFGHERHQSLIVLVVREDRVWLRHLGLNSGKQVKLHRRSPA